MEKVADGVVSLPRIVEREGRQEKVRRRKVEAIPHSMDATSKPVRPTSSRCSSCPTGAEATAAAEERTDDCAGSASARGSNACSWRVEQNVGEAGGVG